MAVSSGSWWFRLSKRTRVVCRVVGVLALIAVLVVAGAAVFPTALPSLMEGMAQNPFAPLLVAAVWMVATTASIAGKRFIAAGHLGWAETTTAHIGGTVANRVIPAGMGAAGAFLAALKRGGATTTTAAGTVALWTAGGALAHATGLLVGLAWLQGGWDTLLIVLMVMSLLVATGLKVARRAGGVAQTFRTWWRTPRWPANRSPRTAIGQTMRHRASCAVSAAREVLAAARARPIRTAVSTAAQFAAMLCMATGFALVAASFGLPVTFAACMAAYVGGTVLSVTTPTPAGIGATEAALVGALIVLGVPASEAVPVVLLFRAVVLLVPVAVAGLMAAAWPAVRWAAKRGRPAPLPTVRLQELQ